MHKNNEIRVKVVSIGTRAITMYYFAIGTIVLLFGVIIVGILISVSRLPPCTSISKNICGVNDWSIAGLAATILGVAATILAILGAFAVAAWWKELNERVKQQVDTHMQAGINQITEEQKRKLEEQAESLLEEQRKRFDEMFSEFHAEINDVKELLKQAEIKLQTTKDIFLLGMVLLHDPWNLADWADEIQRMDNAFDHKLAMHIVLGYLKNIDGFQQDYAKQTERLKKKGISEEFATPLACWNSAYAWKQKMGNDLSRKTRVDAEMKKLEPFVRAWESSDHPSS